MAANVIEISDSNFEQEVIRSSVPVLVDFWAPWCGPCRMLAPTIEELSRDYAGKVKVCKLNTDESPQTPMSYQISSIPTVLYFKNGQVVDRLVGLNPKGRFLEMIGQM